MSAASRDPIEAADLEALLSSTLSEAASLRAVRDPDEAPFRSRYTERELLRELQQQASANAAPLGLPTPPGGGGGRSTDRPHMISHLWLRAGAAYRPKVAPLTISYNDQDYYAPPTLGFVYGVPVVAAVYPRAARAGTAVTVRGELLPVAGDLSDANLDASGGYQCKWTELVRDGFNTPPDATSRSSFIPSTIVEPPTS